MKLFVIKEVHSREEPYVAEIETLKETDSNYILGGRDDAAGYAKRVPRKDCKLSLTPEEAWEKYIAMKSGAIDNLEEWLRELREQLRAAQGFAKRR